MASNIYYHFDSEAYSDLLFKTFSNRDISDSAINNLLGEAENTVNNVLSFEDEINSDSEEISCLSSEDNKTINGLLSNPFLDVYFVSGKINVNNFIPNKVDFQLVEKTNDGFSQLKNGTNSIIVVDSRELAPVFDNIDEYLFGYYDQDLECIVKNLNYKSRHEYNGGDISFESYMGDYSMPVMSEIDVINELYKKLYSLEVLFGKYVDEKGFEDIKNQIMYYARNIVSLKQSISDEMVMDEARLGDNYVEEFVL